MTRRPIWLRRGRHMSEEPWSAEGPRIADRVPVRDAGAGSDRAADDGAIDHQDQHRADNGTDEAGSLALPIPADALSEPGREDRADDPEQRRDDEPARPADEPLGDQPPPETR